LIASFLIKEDIRNNSAWNERWFVIHRGKQNGDPLPLEVACHEAEFAMEKAITLDPYNESPWQYLIGLLKEQLQKGDSDATRKLILEYETKAFKLRQVLEKAGRNLDSCVNLNSARIDLLEMLGNKESLGKVRGWCDWHEYCSRIDSISQPTLLIFPLGDRLGPISC
jgi:protein farnesyltransferase/geranylgeranyltransferase type-1 subunit alpha